MVTRRRVLVGVAGLVAVGVGGVVLADVERQQADLAPTTARGWEVVLTRVANGLPATAGAVAAAAAHPAPQLLVGIPLTASEASRLRDRREEVPLAALGRLFEQNPTVIRLAPRDVPPSARTVRAWLSRPDRQVAEQLHDHIAAYVPVEVHLTRWSRAEIDRQSAAVVAAIPRLGAAEIEVSSVLEPNNFAGIEVMTTRALTSDQQRLIRELAPSAVFSVGSNAGA